MKTKQIKHLLTLFVSLVSFTASAADYDFEVDGIYYTVTSLTDFTCAVTKGDTPYEGTMVIPATVEYNNRTLTVTGIKRAFDSNNTSLRSLTIPNTVLSVENYAFEECSIDSIIIEDGDTEIDLGLGMGYTSNGTFTHSATSYVYIGRNVKNGEYRNGIIYTCPPFRRSNFKVAVFGDRVTSTSSFENSKQLEKVILGAGITAIVSNSFNGCTNLSDISMGDNVVEVGYGAFEDCVSLRTISLSKSLVEIKERAFDRCTSLQTVPLPPVLEKIGRYAFASSGIQNISLPESVTEVGWDCFCWCENLISVELSDAITTLPYNVFADCSNLKSVKMPKSLVSIYSSAFSGCSSLTEIELPQSVKSIEENAFNGCESLTVINALATTPPTMKESYSSMFTTAQYMNIVVNVPMGSKEAYMQANVWKNFWNINEIDPTGIGTVSTDSQEDANAIYTINGVKYNTTNLSDLPSGIYIKNGKKVYVK